MKPSATLMPIPEGFFMKIQHMHQPNALKMLFGKKPPKYVTFATLYDSLGNTVGAGEALCSPRDNPSRKLGRIIAHNRAVLNMNVSAYKTAENK